MMHSFIYCFAVSFPLFFMFTVGKLAKIEKEKGEQSDAGRFFLTCFVCSIFFSILFCSMLWGLVGLSKTGF